MDIILNSRPTPVAPGTTVAVLLESLGFAPQRVAVERNGEIVKRTAFGEVSLAEGDRLEVVQFVGGG